MSYLGNPLTTWGFIITEVQNYKRVKGKCPVCGTKINQTFDLTQDDYYECFCGKFRMLVKQEMGYEKDNN